MVREGLHLLLESQAPDFDLLEAGTCADALAVLDRRSDVDWVMLDLGLPDCTGVQALVRLRERHPEVPVVVLSSSEERALVLECINSGAMGFIGKSAGSNILIEALRQVFAGGIYLPPTLFGRSGGAGSRSSKSAAGSAVVPAVNATLTRLGLSARQVQVLELVVQGMSNKHIASRLELSEATIKTHVAAGLRALNVRNRTQAVFALATWGPSSSGEQVPNTDE